MAIPHMHELSGGRFSKPRRLCLANGLSRKGPMGDAMHDRTDLNASWPLLLCGLSVSSSQHETTVLYSRELRRDSPSTYIFRVAEGKVATIPSSSFFMITWHPRRDLRPPGQTSSPINIGDQTPGNSRILQSKCKIKHIILLVIRLGQHVIMFWRKYHMASRARHRSFARSLQIDVVFVC